MSFEFTLHLYRHLQKLSVFERKVMEKTYTESQQERKQKYCPISPAEIQRFQYLIENALHVSPEPFRSAGTLMSQKATAD